MKIVVDQVVLGDEKESSLREIEISSPFLNSSTSKLSVEKAFAYFPFINAHDHLIGNWYPPARNSSLYPNANIWVKDMKLSPSVKERDKVFVNSIPMSFLKENGPLLALLGGYKNIFSGVGVVQDHAPIQQDEYYDLFPIEVLRKYRQLHSITLGNFWGGEEPLQEMEASKGEMPFIVHLGEGLDETTKGEFSKLYEIGLLKPNTLIIHGISLTKRELHMCADTGASVCWCPFSNYALIGQTLDIDTCLSIGVNVVIGTDSTLSGSINLLSEISYAHQKAPHIPAKTLYKMISSHSAKALFLDKEKYALQEKNNENILLVKAKAKDPYSNILKITPDDIIFFMWQGVPIYGQLKYLEHFSIEKDDYYTYTKEGTERFVKGHPEKIIDRIDSILGYHKTLPYLPFQG
ncbi:MAG: amidohydrolase family protein [Candidatus Cloacimonas sp.]|nr:amidohydrolase family protein [Candidatus Cloacimonadota bacterium]